VDSLRHMDERYRARELVMTLSPREREVLGMIASGARNRTIAASLEISEFTVKRHVQNILRKLGLPSRRVAAMLHQSATVDGRAALERLNPIRLPLLHPAAQHVPDGAVVPVPDAVLIERHEEQLLIVQPP
jgi:DNA-binding CsgD family transcriptional regulator